MYRERSKEGKTARVMDSERNSRRSTGRIAWCAFLVGGDDDGIGSSLVRGGELSMHWMLLSLIRNDSSV